MSPVDPAAVAGTLPRTPALVAQVGSDAVGSSGFDPALSFVLSLGTYLVVGTLLLVLAPRASRRTVERMRDEPGYGFLVGLVGQVGAVVLAVLLAITVVGLVVAIPGLILWALLGIAATALGAVALGAVATDLLGIGGDGRAPDLIVGAVLLAAVSLVPVAGDLVNFVVGSIGIGTLLGMWLDSRSGGSNAERRRETGERVRYGR